MNAKFLFFRPYSYNHKQFFRVFLSFIFCLLTLFLTACKKETDYSLYVSELRSNLFLAKTELLSLRVYAVEKENPYLADGVARETSPRVEVYLSVPSGDQECTILFSVNGTELGGDASYDNVKGEYFYSCTADASALITIDFKINYGETTYELTAKSVRNQDVLSGTAILQKLVESEKELFTSLTDEHGFAGEIYLRLLYESAPYYYAGVTDRTGKTTAFLINAKTGKILARRES